MSLGHLEADLVHWSVQNKIPNGYQYHPAHRFYGAVIDLWVESANEVWLVEAKKIGDHDALGQLLYYKMLYEDNNKPKTLRLILVCRELAAYTHELYGRYGISVVVGHQNQP